jgi:hypothetical protein
VPITYQVNEATNFIHAVVKGPFTGEDLLEYDERLRADPRVRGKFTEFFDATAGRPDGSFQEAFEEIWRRDDDDPIRCAGSKTAIVVAEDRAFELAKAFEMQSGPRTVIVFYNPEVARTWVDFEGMAG